MHREAALRARFPAALSWGELDERWLETGIVLDNSYRSLSRAAQAIADAEHGLLRQVARWLHQRGHKSAGTDLTYNWNDTGQPGDGSCRPLHEEK